MFYPEIFEENQKIANGSNPEDAEFPDWIHLKANLLGNFPDNLKYSKELLDWIMNSSYITHPTAVVACFITIISSLTARKVYTDTGCSTTLYTIAIAPTGSGKDIVMDIPKKVSNLFLRQKEVLIQGKINSEAALDDIFKDNDVVTYIVDEFGDILGQMLKGGSSHFTALMRKFKTLYSSTNGTYESARYSSSGGRTKLEEPWEKEKPCFILTGITTKEQLLSNLKEKMIHDGFLNRFIIMNGSNIQPWQLENIVQKNIPESIKNRISAILTTIFYNKNELIIKRSIDAKKYYNDFIGTPYKEGSDIQAFCKNGNFEENAAISNRWRENALRLATALTAYDISLVPVTYESISEVSKEVLEWSYTFIKNISIEFYKTFEDEANQTTYQKNKDKAIKWFKEKQINPSIKHSLSYLVQYSRVFKNLQPAQRKVLLNDLIESGIIDIIDEMEKKYYKYK